jgi:CHAT domain-containing protein
VLRKELAGRRPAPKTIAVVADPVFDKDDPRVRRPAAGSAPDRQADTPSGERDLIIKKAAAEVGVADADLSIERLPGTRQEAERILALVPESDRLQALGFAADRKTAESGRLADYRFVHFATHGFLHTSHPEYSGLVLSLVNERGEPQSGFLLANEVYNLRLPAEMVVLSACQTGLGKEVAGQGLTRGFMYAGARRVIVSLWNVSDDSTAELMEKLYNRVLGKGERPAAALRAAQIELWNQKRWQAPYYWAAFVLQGEWN